MRTKKWSFGVTRDAVDAPSSERSVKRRASSPVPSRRPNGGVESPPGFPSGTIPMKRALDVCVKSDGSRSALDRKLRRVRDTNKSEV